MDYRSSGVDIEAGCEVVRRIRSLARATFTPGVLSEIGSFGGLFTMEPGRADAPVLLSADSRQICVTEFQCGERLINALLEGILSHDGRGNRAFRVVVTDITERTGEGRTQSG